MKKQLIKLFLFITITIGFTSCRTIAPKYDYQKLAKASIKLGMDIDLTDNHKLYIEAAEWMGVPYRYGGESKKGVDCSGLTAHIYKKVYRKKLERSSEEQRSSNCYKITKRNLKEGDLVFFSNNKSKKKAPHVGIYLKNNKFIHSSTSQGVIISDLEENYYHKYWLSAGRVK